MAPPKFTLNMLLKNFLARAAAKFFTCSAKDLVSTITPIVPNIAACRGLWTANIGRVEHSRVKCPAVSS
jgi:hypothetical protein